MRSPGKESSNGAPQFRQLFGMQAYFLRVAGAHAQRQARRTAYGPTPRMAPRRSELESRDGPVVRPQARYSGRRTVRADSSTRCLLTPARLGYSLVAAGRREAMTKNPTVERDGGAAPTGAVRQRVIKHLRSVLVPGAIGLTACKSSVVCDPMPTPQDAGTATGHPQPTSTFTPPVVCDPMPPPPADPVPPPPADPVPPPPADPVPRPAPRHFATPPPGASTASPGSTTRTPPRTQTKKRPPVVCDPMPPPAPTRGK